MKVGETPSSDSKTTPAGPEGERSLTGRRVGEFVIGEKVGEGGYGFIYRATQETLSREVVIKVLRWRGDERDEQTRRFLREAQLASQLDHPYAAHIYSFGAEPDGLLWIAMELVRGTPLKEVLQTQGSIPLSRFVPLLDKICEVVYTAHQQGIVHRDIKPSNVMVLSRAGQLLPKLLDFGIARLVDASRRPDGSTPDTVLDTTSDATGTGDNTDESTRTVSPLRVTLSELHHSLGSSSGDTTLTRRGSSLGSPPYMAPEQWITAAESDARTDQYALAILAYEAIAGKRPFRAKNPHAMAMAHASRPVPPLGGDNPIELDRVLQRALAKKQSERYEHVLAFAQAFRLAAGLESEPDPVPRLEVRIREAVVARAPQPLADSVAALDAARNPARALEAAQQVVRVAVQLSSLLAIAVTTRIGPSSDDNRREAIDGLRQVRHETMEPGDWLALLRALVKPYSAKPDAYPIAELVLFATASDSVLHELLPADHRAADFDRASAADPRDALERLLPRVARLLEELGFLFHYPWIVRSGARKETWMGISRTSRPRAWVQGHLEDGAIALTTGDGDLVLTLSPLLQVLAPAPGTPDSIFMLDGYSRFGARLVSFPVGFERHDTELWGWLRKHIAGTDGDEDDDTQAGSSGRAPYMGLASFSPDDADNYFGREREVQACVNRLRIDPLLAVVGPSGAGKSSFVQAGILPAMPSDWHAITVRPGSNPMAQLAARLVRDGFDELADLTVQSSKSIDTLGHALRERARRSGQPILLIVDQFEELLTLCLDSDERDLYAQALMQTARSGDDPVRVIITLRDDFLIRMQHIPALRERLGPALQLLGTPPPSELERILVEPARRLGYRFEDPALPVEMVSEVADEPGALALLSFTASKLWELRDRQLRQLPRRAYETLGGVGGALAQHAEETLSAMAEEQQALVREVFRQMITADGTRAILTRKELGQILGREERDGDAVLEALIQARLLVASEGGGEGGGGAGGEDRIEVVHEALLSSWPRLVGWQREDAENVRLRDQLRAAARQWVERERPSGLLWRGDVLLEYRVWRNRYRGALTEAEEDFARTSLDDEERGRRRRRAVLIAAFAVLAAGLVAVLFLAQRASTERDRANVERERATSFAERSKTLAEQSRQRLLDLYRAQGRQALLSGDPRRAFVYLLEAHDSGADDPALRFMLARASDALDGQLAVLEGHQGPVYRAVFSPDGGRIATASGDRTARIWDSRTGEELAALEGHDDAVWSVAFSPDGSRLVTGSWDGTVSAWDMGSNERLWSERQDDKILWVGITDDGAAVLSASRDGTMEIRELTSGRSLRALRGHRGGVTSGALASNGEFVVTGSHDRTAKVWSRRTGQLLATSPEHDELVVSVAIAPDNGTVASGSWDGVIQRIAPRGGPRQILRGHAGSVQHLAFAPDGERLASASEDRTARIWDLETGDVVFTLEGHISGVTGVLFSPTGDRVLTVSRDSTAMGWETRSGARSWTFIGHRDAIWSASLDSSGERMVTAGFDGTARVWNARQVAYMQQWPEQDGATLRQAAFSPDGATIASAWRGGAVRLDRGDELVTLQTDIELPRMAWSPSGRMLVTSGGSRAVVWDAASGREIAGLAADDTVFHHAAFAPQDDRIITAMSDGTAVIWDLESRTPTVTLRGHESKVRFATFDATGQRALTASDDQTARIWDAASGALLHTLTGHTLAVNTARFNKNNDSVITASDDRTAILWSASGELLRRLEGHSNAITDAVFSPDGEIIATAGEDGAARLWARSSGAELWSIDLAQAPAWSVDFSADGQVLLIASGRQARAWKSTYDDLDRASLDRFAACRIGYALKQGQIVRRERDTALCAHR